MEQDTKASDGRDGNLVWKKRFHAKETAWKIYGLDVAMLEKNILLLRGLRMSFRRVRSTWHHFVGVVVSPYDSLWH